MDQRSSSVEEMQPRKGGSLSDLLWVLALCVALAVCLVSMAHAKARYAAARADLRRAECKLKALQDEQERLRAQKKALDEGSPFIYEWLGREMLKLVPTGAVGANDLPPRKNKR